MKSFLLILCCICTHAFCFIPRSSIGNTELIGNLQEGFLIPLVDFSFKGSKIDNGSPCLKYKSRIFPDAEFVFVRDLFDSSMSLEEYADWFTEADFCRFCLNERIFLDGGINGTTPMLLQRWENSDSYYFQLFFGRGREGFCCFVYLPKPAFEEEYLYWHHFFANLPYFIDLGPRSIY